MDVCARCHKPTPPDRMTKARWMCKVCWRDYMRFRRYGITAEDYERMSREQDGACAICRKPNVVPKKNGMNVSNLAVDHDAASGRVRGLLCGRCNRGIGYLKHDPALLAKAARYLVGW